MQGFFFVCLSEMIEELASRRDTKIGMSVSNDESMIKFENLSEIFTPLQKNGKQFFTPLHYTLSGQKYFNTRFFPIQIILKRVYS